MGEDPDFHRGEAAYDKMYGDYRPQPNPCLRPLTQAPFYAMPIYPGDIGTNGGLATNATAQVVDIQNQPIPGLYGVGNRPDLRWENPIREPGSPSDRR